MATGLKIRTEFQDIVEALSGEFEDEMLASALKRPLSAQLCGLCWLTGGAVRAGYQNDGMCVHSARPFCRSTLLISLLLCRDFRREFCVTRNKGALPPLALRTLCS